MPKLSAAALDQRRRHILEAATVCFARDGLHRTTIADICREASVSTGAVYVYFQNKESIVRAILEDAQRARLEALDVPAATEEERQREQLRVLAEWAMSVLTPEGRLAARLDLNLWAEATRNPEIALLARKALVDASASVAELVARRKPAGPLEGLDARTLSALLVSLFLGLEIQASVGVPLELGELLRVTGALLGLPLGVQRRKKAARRRRAS